MSKEATEKLPALELGVTIKMDEGLLVFSPEACHARELPMNSCLGYLMDFREHGIFEAEYGLIKGITKEQSDLHNKTLDRMYLHGMDETCKLGQGNTFYLHKQEKTVKTFTGEVVATDVLFTGKRVATFKRKQRTFSGKWHAKAEEVGDGFSVFFVRTA